MYSKDKIAQQVIHNYYYDIRFLQYIDFYVDDSNFKSQIVRSMAVE